MKKEKNKKAQITIFIIIGIILIAVIALVFSLLPGKKDYTSPNIVKGDIQKCERDAVMEAEKAILPSGGLINLSLQNYIGFNGTNILWFCYTPKNRELCVTKHPLLNLEMENEIKRLAEPKIIRCFENIKGELSGYNYQEGLLNFNVIITPDNIVINSSKEITYTVNEQTRTISNFDTIILSPAYDFIAISNRIINEELSCNCPQESCNPDVTLYNKYYPDFEIIKPAYSTNGSEAYSIREILTNKKFNFAVRNCVRS
jgi:hypothetical protein